MLQLDRIVNDLHEVIKTKLKLVKIKLMVERSQPDLEMKKIGRILKPAKLLKASLCMKGLNKQFRQFVSLFISFSKEIPRASF